MKFGIVVNEGPYTHQASDSAYNFLKQSDKKLFFNATNFTDKRFGSGWAWDDANSAYSA